MLYNHKALEEYRFVLDALLLAKKGTLGAWKASALYRTMYIGGHEAAFEKKGLGLVLSKKGKTVGSLLELCFVDLKKVEKSTIESTYKDHFGYGAEHVVVPYKDWVDAD